MGRGVSDFHAVLLPTMQLRPTVPYSSNISVRNETVGILSLIYLAVL